MTTSSPTAGTVVELLLERIVPDPIQPRLHPDADLADSIATVGVLQPIRVEVVTPCDLLDAASGRSFFELAEAGGYYMIQDGERRYRGSIAAGRTTIPALVVEALPEHRRLIRQLAANTGKPLTPIEEARALAAIFAAAKEAGSSFTQAELAKAVGKPRSLVGDRLRMLELDPVWLDLIDAGILQVSHAPLLHQWAAVPSTFQAKAAAGLNSGWRVSQAQREGEPISVSDLAHDLYSLFRDYVKPLRDVKGYKGPIVEVKSRYGTGKEKLAADPALWRPIWRNIEKKRKKERESRNTGYGDVHQSRKSSWIDKLPAGVESRSSSDYYPHPGKGERAVLTGDGWAFQDGPFDPTVVLAQLAPGDLIKVVGKYSVIVVTKQLAVMEQAAAAYHTKRQVAIDKAAAGARAALTKEAHKHSISGPGTLALLSRLFLTEGDTTYGPTALPSLVDLAAILQLGTPETRGKLGGESHRFDPPAPEAVGAYLATLDTKDTELLLAAAAASTFRVVKLPKLRDIEQRVERDLASTNPKWTKAT